ncbi:MAG TPA: cyclopropane-fatty-acyl-phospholipid synthase family protein [Thiobacillus sp.]|nr:MAG: SAM-dependent methyltransferase [Hydrogenophilales bacterium 28-61-11]OYZ58427.1 MAG: SAM-dependent methyltransferase [Hydrogenophilales bacterium 16-61-112]OZA45920.1 MAG: SAM-dependent methyltransferase [Hydrogenophilales bacterium 17-61-76]HQT29678.1 cyclopropane-fatty-acyl-phospholipid synthase family protein [Thiobacillus sp.]HQT70186.1 cyclopropane-fatty-acyl-phospholipid synthase family protein [Thiobacillus sp.]
MLDRLRVHQMRLRVEASGLPLVVELWDGQIVGRDKSATVRVRLNQAASLKAMAEPSLGALARAYVEGALDLHGTIRDILALGDRLCNAGDCAPKTGSPDWKWWRHTRSKDRKYVQYHYDVSNDFYALWLDTRRVYSCAYFKQPDMSLDDAQLAKLDHICRKLDLQPEERLLDIGCGWGGLILHAAEHYGVNAVGITLSDEQHAFVSQQIAARCLRSRVEVRHMDYRDVPEHAGYDKIASVGMFEHVGRLNLRTYFDKIHALLKPGGLVLNHGITTAEPDASGLGSGIAEFIEDYVFPGGELVHASEVLRAASGSGLECLDAENLRPHYAHTLWHWVTRLEQHADEARRLIGEQKYRIWRIYMGGSAYAFEHDWMELWQVLAGKAIDGSQPNYPFKRDYIYCHE